MLPFRYVEISEIAFIFLRNIWFSFLTNTKSMCVLLSSLNVTLIFSCQHKCPSGIASTQLTHLDNMPHATLQNIPTNRPQTSCSKNKISYSITNYSYLHHTIKNLLITYNTLLLLSSNNSHTTHLISISGPQHLNLLPFISTLKYPVLCISHANNSYQPSSSLLKQLISTILFLIPPQTTHINHPLHPPFSNNSYQPSSSSALLKQLISTILFLFHSQTTHINHPLHLPFSNNSYQPSSSFLKQLISTILFLFPSQTTHINHPLPLPF